MNKQKEKKATYRVLRIEDILGSDQPQFTLVVSRMKKTGEYETVRLELSVCSWHWLARAIRDLRVGAAKNVRQRRWTADFIEKEMQTRDVVIPE